MTIRASYPVAARLQLAGLHAIDRVGLAKLESRLRSAFDYEVADTTMSIGSEANKLYEDAVLKGITPEHAQQLKKDMFHNPEAGA